MKRRRTSDEIDAALRAHPDYQELTRLLSKQTDAQRGRLETHLSQLGDDSHERGNAMSTKEETNRRLMELKSTGLSHERVAEKLNVEGFTNESGGPFTKGLVQKRWQRLQAKLDSQQSQPCEDAGPEGSSGEPCKSDPTVLHTANLAEAANIVSGEPCETSPVVLDPRMIATLRNLIREEIQTMHRANTANLAEMPPPIPKMPGSKKYLGERVTLPGMRIDRALWELFEAERRNHGMNASDAMQRILWLHFNRPRLSFEPEE